MNHFYYKGGWAILFIRSDDLSHLHITFMYNRCRNLYVENFLHSFECLKTNNWRISETLLKSIEEALGQTSHLTLSIPSNSSISSLPFLSLFYRNLITFLLDDFISVLYFLFVSSKIGYGSS